MDIDSDDDERPYKARRLPNRRNEDAMVEMVTKMRGLEQQIELFKSRAKIAEETLRKSREHEEDTEASIARYAEERDAEKWRRRRAVSDSEALSAIITRHASSSVPEQVQQIRDTGSFSAAEMRTLETEVWTSMLKRLTKSPIAEHLYSFSKHAIDGERIIEHRRDVLTTKHPHDHWLAKELRHQIVTMVVDVCYRWRLSAPWHLDDGENGGLWWWRHPCKGLLQSDTTGVETAFRLVHSNIVHRFMRQPTYRSTDKIGDAYFRDHAQAVDQVMSAMRIEDVTEDIKAGIVARHRLARAEL